MLKSVPCSLLTLYKMCYLPLKLLYFLKIVLGISLFLSLPATLRAHSLPIPCKSSCSTFNVFLVSANDSYLHSLIPLDLKL